MDFHLPHLHVRVLYHYFHWIAYKKDDKEFNENNDIALERADGEDENPFVSGCSGVVIAKSEGLSPEISGTYENSFEPKNGHPSYHKDSKYAATGTKYIYWEDGVWYVSDMLGINTCNAYLKDDVDFPYMSTKQWLTYDEVKNEFNKDNNMIVEKGKNNACTII
jgi:hypothetical protein